MGAWDLGNDCLFYRVWTYPVEFDMGTPRVYTVDQHETEKNTHLKQKRSEATKPTEA
jgi:hypothetical protein